MKGGTMRFVGKLSAAFSRSDNGHRATGNGQRTTDRGPRATLASDFWGGLAAMLVALPSSVAFGVVIFTAVSPGLASAGALAGITGAAVLGIVAPLVGRNGGFITAPCAPAAAVLSGLALELAHSGKLTAARILLLLALTALLSAAFQIAYGAFRFGRVIKFIPYQVVTGYLSGVAVIIAAAQIPKLLGASGGAHLAEVLVAPRSWSWIGIVVGLVTIVAMRAARNATRSVPEVIVGLAAGIGAYFAIALGRPELWRLDANPLLIGPIPRGAALFDAISARASALSTLGVSDLLLVLGPALTLSILLSIDTLKTGVVLDALTRARHDSNRELIGQGVANVASCVAGGLPGAGTMGATLVNITSGGRRPRSGVIEGLLVVTAFLAIGKLIAWVPIAALAGVLLVVAWRMFDFGMFRLLEVPSTRLDFVVIASVIIVAATVGLIEASLVGVCLAILLFIRNQIRELVIQRKTDLRELRSNRRRATEEMRLLDEHGRDALVVQLRGDLFFGTTDQLFVELERDLAARRFILLDLRRAESMDYTAAHLLTQMQERLRERGGQLLFCGMPSATRTDIEGYLARMRVVSEDGGTAVFETRDSALEWMEERVLESAGWVPAASRAPLPLEEIAIFRDLDEKALREVESCVERRSVSAGERIFDVGESSDQIFFVRSGRVHILLPLPGGKRHHLATMCRGDFFGEMSFLDRGVRSAEAEAAKETELYALSRGAFDELAQRHEELAGPIFERLAHAIAQRLRVTDAELGSLEER